MFVMKRPSVLEVKARGWSTARIVFSLIFSVLSILSSTAKLGFLGYRQTRNMSERMPTETELVYLRLFDDRTIAVDIPREIASAMEGQGWIEWQPPMLGCNSLYSITEAGKRRAGRDDS
jgi:hypothetical protein